MNSKIKFISTKIKVPAPRKNFVKRVELHERLQAIQDYRVILVKGVAGSGKTTLMTSFIREYDSVPFRWLTVDSDNNNIFSFWYYLVETAGDYLGDIKNEISSLFDAMLQKEDIDQLIELVINQLDQEKHLAMVIDDFHQLKDKNLLKSIEYFIKHMPDNIHMVLLTRDEPDIYFGDLIMSGRLLLIDESHLKFNEQEGNQFLTGSLGLEFNQDVIKQINDICEGWVGGLQLIALACINRSHIVMKDIKINNKYTVEYLSKEILDALPEKHRNFLIKTSILNYFDEKICNSLLDIKNSGNIIQELLDKDLFVICVDEERELYRYHNVFGEFLKFRFTTLDDFEKSSMYEKASVIFRETGDIEESIRLLYCNRDYNRMMDVLSSMEPNYKTWTYLSQIPLEYIGDNLDYIIQIFYFHFNNSNFKEIEKIIEFFKEKMEDQTVWRFLKIIKSIIVDFELCTDLLTVEEIEKLKVNDTARAILYLKTAAFLYLKFEFNKALLFLEKAEKYDLKNNPFITFTILTVQCGIMEELGELHGCEKIFEEIYNNIEKVKILAPTRMNYYIGLTGIYTKSFQVEKAENCLIYAKKLLRSENVYTDAGYLYNLIELRLLQGNIDESGVLLHQLLSNEGYQNILFISGVVKLLIYAGIMTDEFAARFIRMYEQCIPVHIRIEDKLALARVMYFKEKPIEALNLLDEILPFARNQKIKFKLVEALLFKVNIMLKEGMDQAEIKNLLREAIYYSYENNILSPYIYEGQYILKHLYSIRQERLKDLKSGEKAFLNQLIDLMKKDKNEELLLSERELEVLNELATGATNKEIGESLCISVATVKTHIINIYSKLQVGNRIEAVEHARKQNLIS